MKDTPIQKAIAELEYAIKSATEVMHEKSGTDEAVMMGQVMFQQNFLKYLQSMLPYERECIEEAYKDGENNEYWYTGTAHDYFTNTYNNPQGGGENEKGSIYERDSICCNCINGTLDYQLLLLRYKPCKMGCIIKEYTDRRYIDFMGVINLCNDC